MEIGGSSNTMQTYPERTGIVINEGGRTTNTTTTAAADATDINPQRQSLKRPKDHYMPIAQVVRIMRNVLPPHAKISDDAKETVQECVSEFINFVTTRANEKCHGEYRKTVSPDDVISAMGSLGFDNYVEPLTVFEEKHRAQDHPERRVTTHHHRHAPYVRHGVHRPVAQMAPPPAPTPRPPMDHHAGRDKDGGEGSSGGANFDPFAEIFN